MVSHDEYKILIHSSNHWELDRPAFNWAHWTIGNLALVFALAAIFLGGSLFWALPIVPKGSYVALVAAFCAVHAVSHLALTANRRFEASSDHTKVRYSCYVISAMRGGETKMQTS